MSASADEVLRHDYGDLLREARELGRADGCCAAPFEPTDRVGPPVRCRGRTPDRFAGLLWADRPGDPPAGLVVNAPLWYAAGFEEALARTRVAVVPPPAVAGTEEGQP